MSTINDLALAIPCPYPPCGAGEGQGCRTKSGRRAGHRHSQRIAPVWAAWRVGFEEGIADAVLIHQQLGHFTPWQVSIAEASR